MVLCLPGVHLCGWRSLTLGHTIAKRITFKNNWKLHHLTVFGHRQTPQNIFVRNAAIRGSVTKGNRARINIILKFNIQSYTRLREHNYEFRIIITYHYRGNLFVYDIIGNIITIITLLIEYYLWWFTMMIDLMRDKPWR